jgi:hypothetical protein
VGFEVFFLFLSVLLLRYLAPLDQSISRFAFVCELVASIKDVMLFNIFISTNLG